MLTHQRGSLPLNARILLIAITNVQWEMNKVMFDKNIHISMDGSQTVLLLDDIKNTLGTGKYHLIGICVFSTFDTY